MKQRRVDVGDVKTERIVSKATSRLKCNVRLKPVCALGLAGLNDGVACQLILNPTFLGALQRSSRFLCYELCT